MVPYKIEALQSTSNWFACNIETLGIMLIFNEDYQLDHFKVEISLQFEALLHTVRTMTQAILNAKVLVGMLMST